MSRSNILSNLKNEKYIMAKNIGKKKITIELDMDLVAGETLYRFLLFFLERTQIILLHRNLAR